MNGKFNQHSFATLESFGNTDIFIKPFFEFSVTSGELAVGFKIWPRIPRFRFYSVLSFRRHCEEYGTIAILVVFYLHRLNGVTGHHVKASSWYPLVIEIVEYGFAVPFGKRELNFADNGVVLTVILREHNARLNDYQGD